MKDINKTYRFLSALVLILFLNSLILPAGLSAASLFCNMEMGADNSSAHTCFGVQSPDHSDDMLSDKEVCSYQQICKEALSLRKNEVEAISQLTKSFTPVFYYTGISVQLADYSGINTFHPEPDTAYTTPPAFLLNSVFLN
ncbi:hypothetical protein [Fodinibius sp.]|uniref:hypothetical protein n=1 Tax=Fodinibius sp. TaxID=1872440 RepID=UPI00356A8FB0